MSVLATRLRAALATLDDLAPYMQPIAAEVARLRGMLAPIPAYVDRANERVVRWESAPHHPDLFEIDARGVHAPLASFAGLLVANSLLVVHDPVRWCCNRSVRSPDSVSGTRPYADRVHA